MTLYGQIGGEPAVMADTRATVTSLASQIVHTGAASA
jgi:hypothetical protein